MVKTKTRRRRNKRRNSNKAGMLAISVAMLLIMLVMFVQTNNLKKKDELYQQKEVSVLAQIAEESERTDEIEELSIYMQTKKYIEEVAKDKLGMVYKNEIIFREEDN